MIQIVESQREKCDELRQQFHVLQERQAYLTQLKETLQSRCKQLKEAQAQLSTSGAAATPRLIDELFDESHQPTPKTLTSRNNEPASVTASDVFAYLVASATRLCSQVTAVSLVQFIQKFIQKFIQNERADRLLSSTRQILIYITIFSYS